MSLAVVIPLYNHERFIGEALRSVLAQTHRVDRIVIVDDGSTDGSVAVVEQFEDERIHLFTQANAGAHHAINRGIEFAARDCKFIAILNSDDVFVETRLEKCVQFLEANPRLDLVCTRLRMIDDCSAALEHDNPKARWLDRVWQARRESLPEWLGVANFAKTSSNFVARAEYLRAHPFRAYRYVHDYFLMLDAALHLKLGVLDEELILYRTHPKNTIKSGPLENVTREVLSLNIDLLRDLAPELASSETIRAEYTRYFRVLVQNHADFRAEVFVQVIAQLIDAQSDAALGSLIQSLTGEHFPELNASKSEVLKHEHAEADYQAMLQRIVGSRWFALGCIMGVAPDVWYAAPTPDKRLAMLKKGWEGSGWVRLGRRFGFVPAGV